MGERRQVGKRPQGTERTEYRLELTDSPFRISRCWWSDCRPDGSGSIGPCGLCSGQVAVRVRMLAIRTGLAAGENLSRILQKLTCLEIAGYRIKYSTVVWLIELQIRRGRKV